MATPARYGQAPGALPLVGHAPQLLLDPLKFLSSMPQYGDLVRVCLGRTPSVVVCDPALVGQVLRDDRTYDKNDALLVSLREILGNGLATCPHNSHRRQRRLIQPAFHRARIRAYARTMLTQITEEMSTWRPGQEIDALTAMTQMTTRVTVATMFTNRLAPAAAEQLAEDLSETMTLGLARSMTPRLLLRLPLPINRRFDRARSRARQTVGDLIAHARADGVDHGDLLSVLLGGDGTQGDGFSDAEVAHQISTFFFAGIETTANVLASALNFIAFRPDLQRDLREEARPITAAGTLDLARLDQLTLTGHVLTETLRLCPPVWMTPRKTSVDAELGGHRLAAGTRVILSAYQVHHRGDIYADPADFDPHRWADGTKRPREGFLPYGGGARKCIGDEFAHTQASIVLATLLTRWHLNPTDGPHFRANCRSALRPLGLRLRLSRTSQPNHVPTAAEAG